MCEACVSFEIFTIFSGQLPQFHFNFPATSNFQHNLKSCSRVIVKDKLLSHLNQILLLLESRHKHCYFIFFSSITSAGQGGLTSITEVADAGRGVCCVQDQDADIIIEQMLTKGDVKYRAGQGFLLLIFFIYQDCEVLGHFNTSSSSTPSTRTPQSPWSKP